MKGSKLWAICPSLGQGVAAQGWIVTAVFSPSSTMTCGKNRIVPYKVIQAYASAARDPPLVLSGRFIYYHDLKRFWLIYIFYAFWRYYFEKGAGRMFLRPILSFSVKIIEKPERDRKRWAVPVKTSYVDVLNKEGCETAHVCKEFDCSEYMVRDNRGYSVIGRYWERILVSLCTW